MKLKTLKDLIEFIYKDKLKELEDDVCFIDTHTLKAEAIKWVKDFEKNRNLIRGLNSRSGIEIVFMDFFNITEEDLE